MTSPNCNFSEFWSTFFNIKYLISNKIWTENSHEIFQYIVMKMGDSYELFSEIIYHKKSTYFVSVKGFLYYSQKKVPLIKKFKAFLERNFFLGRHSLMAGLRIPIQFLEERH